MVVPAIVVAVVFCPLGNPEPFSISVRLESCCQAPGSVPPPPRPTAPISSAPTAGAIQGLRVGSAGVLGVSGSPVTLSLLLRVSMLLRPWRLPEPVMPMSPRPTSLGQQKVSVSSLAMEGGGKREQSLLSSSLSWGMMYSVEEPRW